MAEHPLPKFDKPPVVEVALSIQFDRLYQLTSGHLGAYWAKVKGRYPDLMELPEIPADFETFSDRGQAIAPQPFMIGQPSPRLWLTTRNQDKLLQVQMDRVVFNWRRTSDNSSYPSYELLRAKFLDEWKEFSNFMECEGHAALRPNQLEVTYVNVVEDECQSPLHELLWFVSDQDADGTMVAPDDTEIRLSYRLESEGGPWGRLRVATTRVVHAATNKTGTRLTLVGRGYPNGTDSVEVFKGLDRLHEAVVTGFSAVTRPSMHKRWGRTS